MTPEQRAAEIVKPYILSIDPDMRNYLKRDIAAALQPSEAVRELVAAVDAVLNAYRTKHATIDGGAYGFALALTLDRTVKDLELVITARKELGL